MLDLITWPMENGVGLPVFFDSAQEVGLGLYSTAVGSIIGEIFGLLFIVSMIIIFKRSRLTKQEK